MRERGTGWPWTIPALTGLDELPLAPGVTFLVGENGSGKSTLVEGIAVAAGFAPEGGSLGFGASTREEVPPLADALTLVRGARRPRDGFFLRAESFFNVATTIDALDEEGGGPRRLLDSYGGVSLHERSHGESFMALAVHRFRDGGLFVLDEPEAALSPQGLFSLLRRIHELVGAGSQFVIATHSPILLAYPGALIYELREDGLAETAYEDTDHFQMTRAFLEAPGRFLGRLFD
ncbi:AAA family ATPase [Solirubrobacter phytolaccae]|uniref:AAA family ATPase n=1 Tax=Solirubrobacter phytolaccae TaxID=1404360 RepID=UPI0022CDE020|nr:AAA family ATPase [Solirubrobacter phytolaccae]